MTQSGADIFALLVGIDEYQNTDLPKLDGCLSDVLLVQGLLRKYFGVPDINVRTLTQERATHEAIAKTFEEHLALRAKAWADVGKQDPAPAFLFYFAGHGSQAPDATGQEPDGLDETLVPYDSREPGLYDIKDWELGQWLAQITTHTDNVTVILDCCHSGSGTRNLERLTTKVRSCRPDLRPQPVTRSPRTRSLRWAGEDLGCVLLAACQDRQLAKEVFITGAGGQARSFGAFTYALYRALDELQQSSKLKQTLTYTNLSAWVKRQMEERDKQQTPQCEGATDRLLFGGARLQGGFPFAVVKTEESSVWIDGGIVHGLTRDTLLHVYPADALDPVDAGEPLAALRIQEPEVLRSRCVVEGDTPVKVPVHARVIVARPSYGDMQRSVALDAADAGIEEQVRDQLADKHVEPYARLVSVEAPATFRIRQFGDTLELLDSGGARLAPPYDAAARLTLGRDIAHMVRYRNALELRNGDMSSELAGGVVVSMRKLVVDKGELKIADFPTLPDGEPVIVNDELVVIEVCNRMSDRDDFLYAAVLDFSYNHAISLVYPRVAGAHEVLKPRLPMRLGFSRQRKDQLLPGLPDELNEVRSTLKVIVTREQADYDVLQQPPLFTEYRTRSTKAIGKQAHPTALSKLLELAMQSGTTRFAPPPPRVQDEWTTVEAGYVVVQKADARAVSKRIQGGRRDRLPAYALEFEVPSGLAGRVSVLSERQVVRFRGREAAASPVVPGLSRLAEGFQPLDIPPVHYAGAAGIVIEIEADAAASSAITAVTPLRLHLSPEMIREARILVVAYDGNQYYAVGRSTQDPAIVHVERLPAPATAAQQRTDLFLYSVESWPAWLDAGWNPGRALPW